MTVILAKGAEIYESAGWKQYLENYKQEQELIRQTASTPSIKVDGNAIIGNNNSSNNLNQGRLRLDLPTNQPTIEPKTNDQMATHKDIQASKSQFIYWLFATFIAGIGVGIAIMKVLQH
jgi:hypothetical protein